MIFEEYACITAQILDIKLYKRISQFLHTSLF